MAEPRWNRSLTALVVAWVVVLAALAGTAGYVALQRYGAAKPEVAVRQAPRTSMVLELPATHTALSNAGQANEAQTDGNRAPLATGPEQASVALTETTDSAPQTSTDASESSDSAATAESGAEPGTEATGGPDQALQSQAGQSQAGQGQPAEEPALPAAPEQAAPAAQIAGQPAGDTAEPATEGTGGQGAVLAQQETAQGEGAPQQEAALPPGGEPPWRQFATSFDAHKLGPRVAIVLSGLGLSAAATEAAIKQLPPEITLSFSPYARLLNQWIALARANGHEVLLDLPMEPLTFPADDPGPHALLTVLDEEQNQKRLDWLLRRGTSYVGVCVVMGSRFTASSEHMEPVLESLKERGLLFLDNRSSEESTAPALADKIGLPLVVNDRTLDSAQASRVAINARLSEIERLARENNAAVAMAQPYPVTIERLRDWSAELAARGFVLAPITALATSTLAKQ